MGGLRNGEHEAEPEPRLWIEHGFADMVPFPDAGANTHLIHAETLNGNDFFVFFKELGLHWGIRHEEAVRALVCLSTWRRDFFQRTT